MKRYRIDLIATAIAFACAASSQVPVHCADDASSVNQMMQEADQLYRHRKFEDAQAKYESALKLAEQSGTKDPNIGSCLNALALIAEERANFGEATSLYTRALSAKEAAVGSEDPALVPILTNFAKFDA